VNPIRSIILFENPFLEFFTQGPWYFVLAVYAPQIIYWLINSHGSLLSIFLYTMIGLLSWTLGEYIIHRFLFHAEDWWLPKNPKILANHFLIHGIHHAFPQDHYRLTFPVLPGQIILGICFYLPAKSMMPIAMQNPFCAGAYLGYLIYDMVHYFVHFGNPRPGHWMDMKKYHMQHHYKNGTMGFGVSQKFWDRVFVTEITDYSKTH
jgi:4-hydroxysphinganine ceramide fatty acyl 2-hydroxylase